MTVYISTGGFSKVSADEISRKLIEEGIDTTIGLHKKLLKHKKFIDSNFNVSWLDNEKIV